MLKLHKPESAAFSFYVAASDRDVLAKVTDLMRRKGYVGMVDTAGRVHYLVDGRRNQSLATNSIDHIVSLREQTKPDLYVDAIVAEKRIEELLVELNIPTHLRGFAYLKFILLWLLENEGFIKPISKTVYPALAKHFKISNNKIDRVIRYATQFGPCADMSNAKAIIFMFQRLSGSIRAQLNEKDKSCKIDA